MTTEMFRPFGLGPAIFGAFIILVVGTILAVAGGQSKGLPGVIGAVVLSAAAFCALVFWPTQGFSEAVQESGPVDVIFLPRVLLLSFLFICLCRAAAQVVRHGLFSVSRATPVAQRHIKRSAQ